jgi:hypothetical protein
MSLYYLQPRHATHSRGRRQLKIIAAAKTFLLDLNAQLAEVLLVPHVLVSVLCLVEREDLFIDDRLNVVCLDSAVHLFELQSAADEDAADGADVVLGGGS